MAGYPGALGMAADGAAPPCRGVRWRASRVSARDVVCFGPREKPDQWGGEGAMSGPAASAHRASRPSMDKNRAESASPSPLRRNLGVVAQRLDQVLLGPRALPEDRAPGDAPLGGDLVDGGLVQAGTGGQIGVLGRDHLCADGPP